VHTTASHAVNSSNLARRRFVDEERKPWLTSDWTDAVFIHFEVEPEILQQQVPYSLDLHDGKAYVSLVAFSIRRLRPVIGGQISEWLFRPIGNHEFFNVRTYVRHRDRAGIYFMTEWLYNRLSVALGPKSYGLPYRFGHLRYQHYGSELCGSIQTRSGDLHYAARPMADELAPSVSGTRDEFLLERYTAFTSARGIGRYFQIWHQPWPMVPLEIEVNGEQLLHSTGKWFATAKLAGGNYSPGVFGIWMGAPHRVVD
jgi:uncharacterized protein YqjF (DUF2071 family)